MAVIRSNEATFLPTDFNPFETQGWFDYELAKANSIAASAFTAYFNRAIDAAFGRDHGLPVARFDARAFVIPEADMANIFLWRQQG